MATEQTCHTAASMFLLRSHFYQVQVGGNDANPAMFQVLPCEITV
jgi:hypothetical protein